MRHIFQLILLTVIAATTAFAQITCWGTGENQRNQMKLVTGRSNLYRGEVNFTMSMLTAIQKATPNENIFFSPYSTFHALLLAYFGAEKQSQKELVHALGLEWADSKDDVLSAYRIEKNTRYIRAQKPIEFVSADKIYFDHSIKLSPCMENVFVDELETLDFHKNAEECRKNINGFISNITHEQIPEMLSAGDVTSETQMVLVNAAYFKGQWLNQFDPKNTKQEIFYTPGKESFVPMMHKRGVYQMTTDERLGAHVLNMPYKTSDDDNRDSEMSMVIILPPFRGDAIETVLAKLTPETLENTLKYSMPREIDVWLPKFEFDQKLELLPILRQMGINEIFERTADLSAFSPGTNINFGDAKHFAKIKVDEEGSTAAAATVLFSFRSARPVEPAEFRCDHPFLFLIYDHSSKAVLFTGIYRDPMTQK